MTYLGLGEKQKEGGSGWCWDSLIDPLTPKISLVIILLTICQMIFIMLVWRLWYQIN